MSSDTDPTEFGTIGEATAAPDWVGGEDGDPLVEVDGLTKYFPSETGFIASIRGAPDVQAVDDVSFEIREGETLALVGESGCGKSTLARAVLQLQRPTSGSVRFKGQDLTEMSDRQIRPLRQDMQMIFQDPQSSLNPRMKVGRIIEEPMKAHDLHDKEGRRERAKELLDKVGLDRAHYNRYPHEFSGGQRQRVNLARALSTDPDLIMCDEPVSALDVSIQAQVLNTMRELQEEFDVTYLVISHDLSVVRYIADRVAVMYLGHIVELAEKEELFENPQHPYTQALLEAIPVPDPSATKARATLEGDVPSPINPPSGCRFRTRCPKLIRPGRFDGDREGLDEDLDEDVREAMLDDYEMSEETWRDTLGFARAVKRRSFVLEEDYDAERTARLLEDRFFGEGFPPGESGDVVQEACRLLAEDEWEEAGDLLERTFEESSICALERPYYEVEAEHGDDVHVAACHLHKE